MRAAPCTERVKLRTCKAWPRFTPTRRPLLVSKQVSQKQRAALESEYYEKAANVLVIRLILVLYILPIITFIKYMRIAERYPYCISTIEEWSGVDKFLVDVLVVLGLVPVWPGLKWFFKHPWYKRLRFLGAATLFLLLTLWNISLYALTRDQFVALKEGKALKWYALTPEGVRFFERPGVEFVYGLPLKPVGREVVRSLKLLEKSEFRPIDTRSAQLVTPVTGEPQAWYNKHPHGTFELYDRPAFHPSTAVPLHPFTEEMSFQWYPHFFPQPTPLPTDTESEAGENQGTPVATTRREAATCDEKMEKLPSVIYRPVVRSSRKLKLAITHGGAAYGGSFDPENAGVATIQSDWAAALGDSLSHPFRTRGLLQRTFSGETQILLGVGALEPSNFVLQGKVQNAFQTGSPPDPRLVFCSAGPRISWLTRPETALPAIVSALWALCSQNAAFVRTLQVLWKQYAGSIPQSLK